MKAAVGAVSIAALAVAFSVGASASPTQRTGVTPQAEGAFCAAAPTEVDSRVAVAVNATGVSAPTTAPVAILDTGSTEVDELTGRIVSPLDALAGSDDGSDFDGHGTQVAGIAAGSPGPGMVRGVSPTSPVMPVRIYNRLGESSTQALVAGIASAVGHGASVINISSSSPAADMSAPDSELLTRAIADAFNHGVMVVASVGNEGTALQNVPATMPHVLTVGASTFAGTRATFSNTGPWVDIVAPAASLVAPMPIAYCASGYGVANGTSFAAPAVSGAAALLAALRPELSAQQRFDVLRTSAHDLDPAGRDNETGFGMLDLGAAVKAAPPAAELSPEVDDDPVYVRGANAARHPVLLVKGRTAKLRIAGQVSAAKDPADVYRVALHKGDRFVASATVSGSDSALFLALWKPGVGDYDVTRGVTQQQVVSSGGFSATPELKMRVKTGGTYYVSVEAPDVIDEEDPEVVAPVSQPYQLLMSRTKAVAKKAAPKKPKKKTRKR